ncbi:MAG: ABC transporter substrate-binding protein [Pseudomonadales bacterium]|nr:ABC transporter substrate-binding protein [Pseudomonadales bacterium]
MSVARFGQCGSRAVAGAWHASPCTLVMLVCSALLAACGPVVDRDALADRTIRFATYQPLITFDPHLSPTGPTASTYLSPVYDGLTAPHPDNPYDVLPALATEWRWLDDRTLEFRLREGVRFVDGEPFNADAAKRNLERMLALNGPRRNTMRSIREVSATGPYTLRIALYDPDPTLLRNLSTAPGLMVSPAAFDHAALDLNPVGTGPWIYDAAASAPGDYYRFRVNPDYFDPPGEDFGELEVIVLADGRTRLFSVISGQADIAIIGPPEADHAKRLGLELARRANRWMGMTILDRRGELVPELADVRVRQALAFAVDRQAIADAVYFGYASPAVQPMAPGLGYVPELDDYYRYDPERARALLREAGVEGFSFEVPVGSAGSPDYEAIQHYLRQVGIDMRLVVMESGAYTAAAMARTFPVNTIGYPNYDPDSRHLAIWHTQSAFNPFRIESARINELADEARFSLDPELRARNYREYFDILGREVYSVVYLHVDDLAVYDDRKLQGVRLGAYIDPALRDIRLRRTTDCPDGSAAC